MKTYKCQIDIMGPAGTVMPNCIIKNPETKEDVTAVFENVYEAILFYTTAIKESFQNPMVIVVGIRVYEVPSPESTN